MANDFEYSLDTHCLWVWDKDAKEYQTACWRTDTILREECPECHKTVYPCDENERLNLVKQDNLRKVVE